MTLGQEFPAFAVTLGEDERAPRAKPRALHPRDQPGRHRDRHRHQRARRLRGARVPRTSREITGMPLVTAREPDRGHAGHAAPSCSSRAC